MSIMASVDRETLYELLVEERLTYAEAGDRLDLHETTVARWVSRLDFTKPWHDPDTLRYLYWEREMSQAEIGERFDVDQGLISSKMADLGIETRDKSDAMLLATPNGEDHHFWNGGDKDYGPDWETQRERRIQFDDGMCVVCDMGRDEHRDRFGLDLPVHHIEPRSAFIDDGELDHDAANKLTNLVTLCVSCHRHVENGTESVADTLE